MDLALPLRDQAMVCAAVLLAGMALGAVYDLLRVVRTGRGALAALGCDALFCLLFAFTLFALGMGPGEGRLRLFMPPLLLAGGAAWIALFGAPERRAARRGLRLARRAAAPVKKLCAPAEKIKKSAKKWFTITKNWFTIIATKRRNGAVRPAAPEETEDETQTVQYLYQDRAPCPDCLRDDQPCEHEKPRRGG